MIEAEFKITPMQESQVKEILELLEKGSLEDRKTIAANLIPHMNIKLVEYEDSLKEKDIRICATQQDVIVWKLRHDQLLEENKVLQRDIASLRSHLVEVREKLMPLQRKIFSTLEKINEIEER